MAGSGSCMRNLRQCRIRSWIACVAWLWGTVAGAGAVESIRTFSRPAEDLFTEGLQAYRAGNHRDSHILFERLLELSPNQRTSATLLLQGRVLFHIEEYEAARIGLKQLRRHYGKSRYQVDALLLSGDCYFMEHRYYEASNQYGRLLGVVAPLIVQAAAAERLTGIVKNRLISEQALDNIRLRIGPARLNEALTFGVARWYHRLGWHLEGDAALQAYREEFPDGMFRSVLPTVATPANDAEEDFLIPPAPASTRAGGDSAVASTQPATTAASSLPRPVADAYDGGRPAIGLLLPLSGAGNQRQVGRELMQGVQLANEEAGELFHLTVEDTGIDYGSLPIVPSASETQLVSFKAAKRLAANAGVCAIIGPLFSDATVAAAAMADAAGVPLIAPLAQQRGLDLVGPGVFQLNSTPETQARALAEQAILNLGLYPFAVVAPLSDYGYSFEREFTRMAQSYGANVMHVDWYVPRETKDFKRVFQGVRKAGFSLMELRARSSEEWWLEEGEMPELPEELVEGLVYTPELFIDAFDGVVVVVEDFADAKVIAPQLQFHRLQAQLLGNDNWYEPVAIREMQVHERRYLEGAVFVSSFDRRTDAARRFTSAYRRRFGVDPGLAAYGYDAARLVIEAWNQGNRSRQAVRDWIAGITAFDGASGPLGFAEGRRTNSDFALMRIGKEGALARIAGTP